MNPEKKKNISSSKDDCYIKRINIERDKLSIFVVVIFQKKKIVLKFQLLNFCFKLNEFNSSIHIFKLLQIDHDWTNNCKCERDFFLKKEYK